MKKSTGIVESSFLSFLKEAAQRTELLIYGIVALIVWFFMSNEIPVILTNPDTTSYLLCAQNGMMDVYRPFGYSAFLIYLKKIAYSPEAVFITQYLLHMIASLGFMYTLKWQFRPQKGLPLIGFHLFSAAFIFNPAILYLTNYLISDSLFISLTLFWLTSCIWLLRKPHPLMVVIHVALLWPIMSVRYTGMLYPVFSAGILLWCYRKQALMFLAIAPVLLIFIKVEQVKTEMRKISGVKIFSAFSGWQSANNALHLIPYIDLKPGDFQDPVLGDIHAFALQTPDSVYRNKGITGEYIWDYELPLKKYFMQAIDIEDIDYQNGWAKVSVKLDEYGKALMIKYPFLFARHFILPNAGVAFFPTNTEAFETAAPLDSAGIWFPPQPKSVNVKPDFFQKICFPILPAATTLLWLLTAVALVFCFMRRRSLHNHQSLLIFLFVFMTVYVCFHIYSAPVSIRYLIGLLPLKLLFLYAWLLSYQNKFA